MEENYYCIKIDISIKESGGQHTSIRVNIKSFLIEIYLKDK
jgi:hypothetical protein